MSRRYKQAQPRGQAELFPSRVEDYVDDDNPVRAIEAYINSLDMLKLGYANTSAKNTERGQPAYPPEALLKLYLYGYLNRVKSSRMLEKETKRNLEAIWLMEGLRPCYKTIANFRSKNKKALRKTHKEFILLCKSLSLFEGECIAIDGSFFKGCAGKHTYTTTSGLEKSIKKLDEHIDQWQKSLDKADKEDRNLSASDGTETLKEKLEQIEVLQKQKAAQEQELARLKSAGKTQESSTDPDARLLNKGTQKVSGYNVQIAVDSKHHIIVADNVTSDPNDLKQLHIMATEAKKVLNVESLSVVADGGYFNASEFYKCDKDNITPYVPEPSKRKNGRFNKEYFTYIDAQDIYLCPENNELKKSGKPRSQNNQNIQRYSASESSCKHCPLRSKCITEKSKSREIWRSEHEVLLEKHRVRMSASGDKMKLRKSLVEHPFGTLKDRAGWRHFLLRGRSKVEAEFSLMALGYNFSRVLKVIGLDELLSVLKGIASSRLYLKHSKLQYVKAIVAMRIIARIDSVAGWGLRSLRNTANMIVFHTARDSEYFHSLFTPPRLHSWHPFKTHPKFNPYISIDIIYPPTHGCTQGLH
ncbi:MAG: transposase [Alteromonadaceae bacterium]|nr:MAG: transposase [Alteromonadaceae bacterium]